MSDEIERPMTVEELVFVLRHLIDDGTLDGSEPVLTEQDWGLSYVDEPRIEEQHETVVEPRPLMIPPGGLTAPKRRVSYGGPGIGGEPRRVVVL